MQQQAARATHPCSQEHLWAVEAQIENRARTSERHAKTKQFQDDFMPVDLPAIVETDPSNGPCNDRAASPHQLREVIEGSSALLGLGPKDSSDADHVKAELQSSFRLSMAARMAHSMDPNMDPDIMENGDPSDTSFMVKIMNQLHMAEDGTTLIFYHMYQGLLLIIHYM
jgi:hypothetical protein